MTFVSVAQPARVLNGESVVTEKACALVHDRVMGTNPMQVMGLATPPGPNGNTTCTDRQDMNALTAAVESFLRTRRARPGWIAIPPGHRPRTMEEGYALQKAIHQRLDATGTKLLGYKVGSTTAPAQKVFGLDEPVYAGLFSDGDFPSLGAALSMAMRAPSLECEIAVRLGSDLDGKQGDLSAAATVGAIASCHLACEIIDNRYGDPMAVGVPSLLADDWFNFGFVLGPPNPGWPNIDFSNRKGEIRIDGVAAIGNSNDWLHPLESVQWLARKLAQAGRILRAGDIVLTGTIVAPTRVALPAQSVSISIDGFEALTLGRS